MGFCWKQYREIYEVFLKKHSDEYVRRFILHCEEGWSPLTFASKLPYTAYYKRLMKDKPEFKQVHDRFKKVQRTRSYYDYLKETK